MSKTRSLTLAVPVAAAILVALVFHPDAAAFRAGPLSPPGELKTFRLADPGLQIELVAAEPDIISPVAVAWDELGRMYVVEMSDYPAGPPSGKVKMLEDRDRDGVYDRVTVFADKLAFPTSVLPSFGGILVTAAPDILYFRDKDGDGRADVRQIVLTGFGEGNQQLRVNGLTWGMDNWIYGANGRSDGNVEQPTSLLLRKGIEGAPAKNKVSIRRRDFRFRLDGRPPQPQRLPFELAGFEPVAGFSQFGLARDDAGHRFTSWNTVPMRHVVLEDRYLNRNPYLAEAASAANILDPDSGKIYAISPRPQTFNREPVDFFNAACGLTIYRGDLLGKAYKGNAFVCEPLTNLVHRRVLSPAGATFIAKRGESGREFLASTDPWFHPVNLTTGPDGALYICDFYRQWVEHPQFVAEGLRKDIDFRHGFEHGRIWRVRSKNLQRGRPMLFNDVVRTSELAVMLTHPNGWQRDTAQRLLVERRAVETVPFLRKAAITEPSPITRVHALWTLEALRGLDEPALLAALADNDALVREHGLRLSESRYRSSPPLRRAVIALAEDPDIRVRLQCAAALGEGKDEASLATLAKIAAQNLKDEWVRLAILSGLTETALPFLRIVLAQNPSWLNSPSDEQAQLLSQVAALIGGRNNDTDLPAFLTMLTRPRHGELTLLAGLANGLSRSGWPLHRLIAKPPKHLRAELAALDQFLTAAGETAASEKEPLPLRLLAIQVLAHARTRNAGDLLLELLPVRQEPTIQLAAARALGELDDTQSAATVFERWNSYAIGTRRQLITAFLRRPSLARVLLDAIEQEKLAIAELDPATRDALRRVPNVDVQKRAKQLVPVEAAADRKSVIAKYRAALQLPTDRRRGAELVAKHCMTCHPLQGQGHRVGPDFTSFASRPKETLLADIFDPNREVSGDFLSYVAVTARGEVLTGMIAEETAAAIKLRRAEGAEDTVLRTQIQELRPTGKSLMPEGLEQTLSVQDIADILEYLVTAVPAVPTRNGD